MRTTQSAAPLSLREQVEALLPAWQSWYPSLFDAAQDLGLIRARVCAPSALVLSNRHADIRNEAIQAFREQWCVEDEPAPVPNAFQKNRVPQGRALNQGRARKRGR
jgi:hypothetical protein